MCDRTAQNHHAGIIRQLKGSLSVVLPRLRAQFLRLQGARIGRKTGVGPRFATTIPAAISLGSRVEIEPDVFFKFVSEDARLFVGDYTFVGKGVEIDILDQVSIGEHTLIAPGVFITDHQHEIAAGSRIDEQGSRAGRVEIGSDVWIGAGAVILSGVTIGDGAVIGANAVVTTNVPRQAIVAGVPARILRYRGPRVDEVAGS